MSIFVEDKMSYPPRFFPLVNLFQPLVKKLPKLKIVMEHITTSEAVAFVTAAPANVAATITPQHLLYNRNAIFQVRWFLCRLSFGIRTKRSSSLGFEEYSCLATNKSCRANVDAKHHQCGPFSSFPPTVLIIVVCCTLLILLTGRHSPAHVLPSRAKARNAPAGPGESGNQREP